METIDHRTLRSRATDKEALAERARRRRPPAVGVNGIKTVFVSLAGGVATLEVEFFNREALQKIVDAYAADATVARRIFPITGGHRLIAGAAAGQVQVKTIAKSADFDAANATQPTTLVLTATPIGDYSTYTLGASVDVVPATTVVMDPVFSEIDFKFRPGCFNTNCAPDWDATPRPPAEPVIDYLAKDYDSFRHTMIAAMMQRVPDWQPSSEADLDEVLLDLFSAAADELSDYQDRVMNEAYLASARKRVSLARHARLVDYHIHQGNQASTWLALEVALPQPSEPEVGATRQYYLRDDFTVWSEGPDGQNVVFLSRDKQRVHQLGNRLGLFTWSGAIPSLAAGDTTADLTVFLNGVPATDRASALAVQALIRSGVVTRLLIQEHLNPATGTVNGVDPEKRQLLHLLPGDDGAVAMFDPTTGPPATAVWFVRVRWADADALTANYCFTVDCPGIGTVDDVSLFHANLVEVHHGLLRQDIVFKEPGSPLAVQDPPQEFHYERVGRWDLRDDALGKWGTLCALPDHPLAYRDTPPGGEVPALSTLTVTVRQPGGGEDRWDEVPSLIHSDDSDENGDHFVVETDEDRLSWIRFGNGRNGKALPDGAEVRCRYQVGDGLEGNIGLDKLVDFAPTDAILSFDAGIPSPPNDGTIIRCWNPFDVTNGRAPEPAAAIIRRAPEAYRVRQLRAVTLQDYVDRAEELPGVSRAAARYAWTGSWRTVQVTIDPVGTTVLMDALRRDVARYLEPVRLIGEDLEIRGPLFVPLEMHVSLCADADHWPEDLKAILEQEFSTGWTPDGRRGFFHPDLWTFGQPLKASQIAGRILAIEGVEHIITVTMRRWNGPATMSDEITSVAFNEILQVFSDPDHQELGFIDFVVEGGRR